MKGEIKMEENQTKKENFWTRSKRWLGEKIEKTAQFFTEYPVLVMPVMSGIGMIVGGIAKAAYTSAQERNDSYRVEDDVTGEEFIVRHPLSNDEILELGERMIDGQPKGAALDDMGLLRNERRRR